MLLPQNAILRELLSQSSLRIFGLAQVQAVLLTSLSPVEVPVRAPLCAGLRVGSILKLQDSLAVVTPLGHHTLLKLLASLLNGFTYPVQLRSAQRCDSFDDLVNVHERL